MDTDQITELVERIAARARRASLDLATLGTERKNAFLSHLADRLEAEAESILAANAKDLDAANALALSAPMVERLSFSPERIRAMAEGVRQVASLPDRRRHRRSSCLEGRPAARPAQDRVPIRR